MINPLQPVIQKQDRLARWMIIILSVIVFSVIALLSRVKLDINPGFDVHLFARINAIINATVSVLLVAGLLSIKRKRYLLHKRLMIAALILSICFLISYCSHHLLAGDTRFGGTGAIRLAYFVILITHIFLAAIILPFILFTTYRALTGEWLKHRRLAKITWPIWLYVSVSGVIVYLMISPYY